MEEAPKLTVREVDYLLTIFKKSKESGYARNKQVIQELGVSKSTASLMIKKLKKMGLVSENNRRFKLTSRGEEVLSEKFWRHGVIECALSYLGVPIEDSCKISWKMDPLLPKEVIETIWKMLNKPNKCPCGIELPEKPLKKPLSEYDVCVI